jgi:hypothetical protein
VREIWLRGRESHLGPSLQTLTTAPPHLLAAAASADGSPQEQLVLRSIVHDTLDVHAPALRPFSAASVAFVAACVQRDPRRRLSVVSLRWVIRSAVDGAGTVQHAPVKKCRILEDLSLRISPPAAVGRACAPVSDAVALQYTQACHLPLLVLRMVPRRACAGVPRQCTGSVWP